MKRQRTKNIFTVVGVLALILFASFLRVNIQSEDPLVYSVQSVIIFTVYIGVIAFFGVSVHRRIVHRQIRTLILLIVWEMLLWVLLRTLRYTVFYNVEPFSSWCWYGYYIPMILIPPQLFLISCCLGRQDNKGLPRKLYLIFLPAILLIFGILTNDIHGLAFRFARLFGREEGIYTHGVLYYITVGWMIFFVVMMITNLLKKSRIPDIKRFILLPIATLLAGILYTVLYIVSPDKYGFIEMTIFFCLLAISIIESCIRIGLIPSNTYYGELFNASDISAQIVDKNGRRIYTSVNAPDFTEKNPEFSRDDSFRLDNDRMLRRSTVNGGMAYWVEDVSEMNRIIRELEEIEAHITEENDILSAEIELEQKRAKLEEQNKLYDDITKALLPQLEKARDILACTDAGDKDFDTKLSLIAMLFAHIKRRANLTILARKNDMLRVDELVHCIRESSNYIGLTGCICGFDSGFCQALIPARVVMLAYDMFEELVESSVAGLNAMLIKLLPCEDGFVLKVNVDTAICDFDAEGWKERAKELSSVLTFVREDEIYLTLSYKEGGGDRG